MGEENILASHSITIMLERLVSPATFQSGRLLGLEKDLDSLVGLVARIQSPLDYVADRISSGREADAVNLWLRKLEDAACDADAVLDELSYEILRRKVGIRTSCFSSYTLFAFRGRMRSKIREIEMLFEEICNASLRFYPSESERIIRPKLQSSAFLVEEGIWGREEDVTKMVEKLLRPTDEVVLVFAIVGMAGLGKTTLAKMIYNHPMICSHYDLRVWSFAGENFEKTRFFQNMLEYLRGQRVTLQNTVAIVQRLRQLLEGKRYLLVIDDVWDEYTLWYDLLRTMKGISSVRGNAIVVTTRNQIVASMVPTHSRHVLEKLSNDDCLSILVQTARIGRLQMAPATERILRDIALKSAGIPLFAAIYGVMLRGTEEHRFHEVLSGDVWSRTNNLLEIFALSFRNLPSPSLKKCFAYCSVFPNDFVIDVEDLIQLWMAEGYLEPNNVLILENLGYKCFDLLLQNSLFEEVERDKYEKITHCRMHESAHLLARYVSRYETAHLADSSTPNLLRAQHLVMSSLDERMHQIGEVGASYIRTVYSKSWIPDLAFKRLRVLNLCEAILKELPPSVGSLIRLRYLNLSCTNIDCIPKSLCKLYNLQTLRLEQCPYLQSLPNGIVNLISLRHLYLHNYGDGKFKMPADMGKLSSLQTLLFFNVSEEKGHQIEELGCLKNLRGKLEIRNLEKVRGQKVAEKADIFGKQNLYELKFQWNMNRCGEYGNEDQSVLEGLQPHPNLKGLTVENFMGDKFPSWIMRLNSLVEMNIVNCRRSQTIPTLGHLPVLQNLTLVGMETLTSIGNTFYTADNSILLSRSGNNDEVSTVFFPALRSLLIKDMPRLVEWMDVLEMPHSGCRIEVFPCLEVLIIRNCRSLTTIPSHFQSLKESDLEDVDPRVAKILTDIMKGNGNHMQSVAELKLSKSCVSEIGEAS